MQYKAVIFDMDGLLIDSEPLWQEAGSETLHEFGVELSDEQYYSSTGLRTEEWIEHWFNYFNLSMEQAPAAIDTIIQKAMEKIGTRGAIFPGVEIILGFFKEKNFKIAIATSSPLSLVEVVLKKLNPDFAFDVITSAEKLPFGKPHPQVYLDCASALNINPSNCIAFEDSFNGMIAAKAAKMKCVVVPATADYHHAKWGAADLKLLRIDKMTEILLDTL